MRRNAAFTVVALALGGCSLFKSDDDKKAAAEPVAPVVVATPVATVPTIEIGTTRDGYVITAHGYAAWLGYGSPRLEPRREGKLGPDGYLDYDFVAEAPDPALNLGQGALAGRALRAEVLGKTAELRGITCVRIHGAEGGLRVNF